MNQNQAASHTLLNWVHTTLLLAGILLILALLGWFLAGATGIIWAVVLGAFSLLFGQQLSPQLVLRMYRARPLAPQEAPGLYQIVHELARRAGLAAAPTLYYVPSRLLNAFAVGTRRNAAIGVTDGMLRTLTERELTGVLAHEMSHIRNNDMRVMGIADVASRITGLFSTFGKLLLFLNLPLILMGETPISWWAILLLIFAPLISGLLQLALSRTREFDADLGAVQLTGDPLGLASALNKLEYYSVNIWQQILFPGYRVPDPSLLRTHPHTKDRIARLRQLAPTAQQTPHPAETPLALPGYYTPVTRRPGWSILGFWS
ncbi:MAG: peptidase M48 [Chloroflexi bacterium]|nr:MAG: peptidase M48 [Chloroflexota bacterium]